MLTSKRFLSWLGILILAAVVGYLGLHLWQTRGWQKACGTYLVGGGETCITITGRAGWLKAEGNMHLIPTDDVSSPVSLKINHAVSFRNGRLWITQNLLVVHDATRRVRSSKTSLITQVGLIPSSVVPGDWDAGEATMGLSTSYLFERCNVFIKTFSKMGDILEFDRWKEAAHNFSQLGQSQDQEFAYADGEPVQCSFLHRVDDAEVAAYFAKRFNNERGASVLQMARDIQQRHPQDVYLALHRAELEAWHGNVKDAEEMWALWTKQRDVLKDPLSYPHRAQCVDLCLHGAFAATTPRLFV